MNFSKKLQYFRKLSGWSQESLAEKMNVSRQAVAKWENGKGFPDVNNLQQLAKLFNISVDELLNYSKGGFLSEVIEDMDATKYATDGTGKMDFDSVIKDRFSNADKIISVYRTPMLTKWQKILDFIFGAGSIEMAMTGDSFKQISNKQKFYLVCKNNQQWLVALTQNKIVTRELINQFSKKTIDIDNYQYHKTDVEIK